MIQVATSRSTLVRYEVVCRTHQLFLSPSAVFSRGIARAGSAADSSGYSCSWSFSRVHLWMARGRSQGPSSPAFGEQSEVDLGQRSDSARETVRTRPQRTVVFFFMRLDTKMSHGTVCTKHTSSQRRRTAVRAASPFAICGQLWRAEGELRLRSKLQPHRIKHRV